MPIRQIYQVNAQNDTVRLYEGVPERLYNGRDTECLAISREGPGRTDRRFRIAMHVPLDDDANGFDSFSRVADAIIGEAYATATPTHRDRVRRQRFPSNVNEFQDVYRGVDDDSRDRQVQRFLGDRLTTRLSGEDHRTESARLNVEHFADNEYWSTGWMFSATAVGAPFLGALSGVAVASPTWKLRGLLCGLGIGTAAVVCGMNAYMRRVRAQYNRLVAQNDPTDAIDLIGRSFRRWRRAGDYHRERRDGLYRAFEEGIVVPLSMSGPSLVFEGRSLAQLGDFNDATLEIVQGRAGTYGGVIV